MNKKIISTDNAPKAIGPYSQAVIAGGFVFISGQIPINPETNQVVKGGIEEQTEQVLKNITAIIQATSNNMSLKNIISTTLYIKDMNDFAKINEVYSKFFTTDYPARVTVEVSRLPKDVLIEISAIALV